MHRLQSAREMAMGRAKGGSEMTGDIFPESARATLTSAYPDAPVHIRHRLADHPLLTIEALSALAGRMRPETIEYVTATDLPLGIRREDLPENGLSVQQTLANIDQCGSWVLLRDIEQDPAYAALLEDVLGQIAPLIEARTGPMMKLRGYIFVSSPRAVTQLHFDPEYNILFQARGAKTMTLFPAADPEIIGGPFFEQYFAGGQRYLPWKEDWAARGQPISIVPGEAIYVPIFAPHWVQTHDDVSISLSLTWCGEWSIEATEAHLFNRWARRMGLSPAPPRPFPRSNRIKALGHRALARLGWR
jgi:hypothetical protein